MPADETQTPTPPSPASPPSPAPPAQWDRLKEIVADALELPPAEQQAFLDAAAGGDSALRAEAAALVAEAGDPDTAAFLLHPRTDAFLGLTGPDPALLAGQTFGKYELLRLLGEGATSAVYLARQSGLERPVALKILRGNALSYDAHARFTRELAAHTRIVHPGIAQIFDAGLHRDPSVPGAPSTPFIAMEFVDGQPLTAFAARHRLSLLDRLRLIADVADAVHAAHQRAIVHCDLKPANVLVVENGSYGRAKVLDFGIARALGNDDAAATTATARATLQHTAGILLGTLGYMAPEQIADGGAHIDVRTDVYALGVLLYELVAGKLPVPVAGLSLTQALSQLSTPDISAATLGNIPKDSTHGDLLAVLLTALAPEPARRYASAEALARDLRNILADLPVSARLPTRAYRTTKFIRRHRVGVVAATVVALALIAGATTATIGLVREAAARRRATQSERVAISERAVAETASARAEAQARRASSARGFLTHILEAADPESVAGGKTVTLLAAIQNSEPDLSAFTRGDRLVESDIRITLAHALRSLGEFRGADKQYTLAIAAARASVEQDAGLDAASGFARDGQRIALLQTFDHIGSLANENELVPARSTYNAAKTELATLLAAGKDSATPNLSNADLSLEADKALASLLHAEGDFAGAADLWMQVLPKVVAATAFATRESRDTLAPAGTLTATTRTSPTAFAPAPGDELVTLQNNAATALLSAGRTAEAIDMMRHVVDYRAGRYTPDHPLVLRGRHNLARALETIGQLDEAQALLTDILARAARSLGPDDPITLSARGAMISVLQTRQDTASLEQALSLADANIASYTRRHEQDSADMSGAYNGRAVTLSYLKRDADATVAYREGLAAALASLGPDHPFSLSLRSNLAQSLINQGNTADGAVTLREVLAIQRRVLGETDSSTLITRNNLAMIAIDARDTEGAKASAIDFADCVRLSQAENLAGLTPILRRNLGRALTLCQRYDEAERELLKAYEESKPISPTHAAKAAHYLAELYVAWPGHEAAAAEWRAHAK